MQLKLYSEKVWFYQTPIDFRKSLDGLIQEIQHSQKNPSEGLYLFCNKSRTRLKGLCWHKNGFLMLYKRLEKGHFSLSGHSKKALELRVEEFEWLLAGLNWSAMRQWGDLSYSKFN